MKSGGATVRSLSSQLAESGNSWGGYWITPKDEGNNYVNNFPKIISMGISTKYYADSFPYLDFTNKGNENFYGRIYNGEKALTGIEAFINTTSYIYDKSKFFIKLFANQVKMKGGLFGNPQGNIQLYLNVFNTSTKNFSGSVGFDPYKGAWKFYGNPEMSVEYVSGVNAQGYVYTRLY